MKKERYWPVLGTWLKDTTTTPPDPQQTARKVAERIPETPQVRRRWCWPQHAQDFRHHRLQDPQAALQRLAPRRQTRVGRLARLLRLRMPQRLQGARQHKPTHLGIARLVPEAHEHFGLLRR